MHDELRRVDRAHVGSKVPPPNLSGREREILTLLVDGAGNRDIAQEWLRFLDAMASHAAIAVDSPLSELTGPWQPKSCGWC